MTQFKRLSYVSLDTPISDPADRATLPMSTLIGSEQWLIEAAWDGSSIGDVQIFRNMNCNVHGARLHHGDGTIMVEDWHWWGGVPRGKIKGYKFWDAKTLTPMTTDEGLPFELPNAQRKAKPLQVGPGSGDRAP
jgi:hypothetical protein